MAISTGSIIKFEYMMSGGPPMIVTAVAQTDTTGFIKGMPMGLDASGEWFRATTGKLGPTSNFVEGIALQDYPGAGESLDCVLVTPKTVFSAVVAHATTASAVTGSTLIGNIYPIESCATFQGSVASGTFQMHIASTAFEGGYCMGLKDDAGTAYGRAYFVFSACYSTESPYFDARSTA